jgi:hypothetical protein
MQRLNLRWLKMNVRVIVEHLMYHGIVSRVRSPTHTGYNPVIHKKNHEIKINA